MENPTEGRISTEARGHVFLMGIDRTRKMNASICRCSSP